MSSQPILLVKFLCTASSISDQKLSVPLLREMEDLQIVSVRQSLSFDAGNTGPAKLLQVPGTGKSHAE